jgi:quinol monooxygenase YgiN
MKTFLMTITMALFSLIGNAQQIDIKIPSNKSSHFSIPKDAVTIIAWTKIKAGSEQKVMKATKLMMDKIRKNEPRCLIFEAHQGETAPGLVLFYEVFTDEAAFENHQQATYVQDWFDAIEGFTTMEMNVNRMTNFNTH